METLLGVLSIIAAAVVFGFVLNLYFWSGKKLRFVHLGKNFSLFLYAYFSFLFRFY